MTDLKKKFLLLMLINFLVLTGFVRGPQDEKLLTAGQDLKISFNEFIVFSKSLQPLKGADSEAIYGVFVPDKFSFAVEQQPAGHPEFVSNQPDYLTQFSLVSADHSFALLAHNHLAGANFSEILVNDYLITIDQLGTHVYQVSRIENYQALSPNSPYSDFLSLDGNRQKLSATQLFQNIYTQENQLVLQTCLEKDGELSWGRTFIIAEELTDVKIIDHFYFDQRTVSNASSG